MTTLIIGERVTTTTATRERITTGRVRARDPRTFGTDNPRRYQRLNQHWKLKNNAHCFIVDMDVGFYNLFFIVVLVNSINIIS